MYSFKNRYKNKIIVHPDANFGDGYFSKSNWSRIWYNDPHFPYPELSVPLNTHYGQLCFKEKWSREYVDVDKLEGASIIDLPESFECVEDYIKWIYSSGIKINENDLKWIIYSTPNLEHKVMRNYCGVHVFPGSYGIVGLYNYPTKMLDSGTHQHMVRYYNAKRVYQTFCGSSFKPEHLETYKILSTIPDLTEKEMHDFGIEDFG